MTASTAISGVIAPKIMQMVALDSTKEQLTRMMIRVGRLQLALLSVILVSFTAAATTSCTCGWGKPSGTRQARSGWGRALCCSPCWFR